MAVPKNRTLIFFLNLFFYNFFNILAAAECVHICATIIRCAATRFSFIILLFATGPRVFVTGRAIGHFRG